MFYKTHNVKITEVTKKVNHLEKKVDSMYGAVIEVLDSLDTSPDFIYKCCGKKHKPPEIKGAHFPICDECLTTLGQLTKARNSWKLR